MRLPAAEPGGTLALDLARVTGWAYAAPGGPPVHGEYELSGAATWGEMLAGHEQTLLELLAAYQPALIAYEAPVSMPHDVEGNRRTAYGLAAVTEKVAWEAGLACHSASPQAIRGSVLQDARLPRGQGKAIVLRWLRERGLRPQGHNAADALMVLLWAAPDAPALQWRWDGVRFWRQELV